MLFEVEIDLTACLDLTDAEHWAAFSQFLGTCGAQPPKSQIGPEVLFRPSTAAEADRIGWNYEDNFYMDAFFGTEFAVVAPE